MIVMVVNTLFSQNNDTKVEFIKSSVNDEYLVEIYLNFLDSFMFDLENSYLSFVDNNFDSIDCGEYKVIRFRNSNMPLTANFIEENSNPPKFVKIHSVFVHKYDIVRHYSKTEYFELIFKNQLSIFYNSANEHTFFVYFNDSELRNAMLFSLIGGKIMEFKNIKSGCEIDIGFLPRGVYLFSISGLGTRKIFLK